MTYIIYCDESSEHGGKFGDFFGGCIINSKDLYEVTTALEERKKELNLNNEIKWTRVSANYLDKYISMVDLFFEYVKAGKVKVRIMFRRTEDKPARRELSFSQEKYFKLYYQFIKHAFGLMSIPEECTPANIIINLDTLPDKHGQRDEFKMYLQNMPNTRDFCYADISIRDRDIIEVDSKDHVLMQCTDIVLGAMNFKLNGLDQVLQPGTNHRGKRTVAKDKLYMFIRSKIWEIFPNFNIGVSTGNHGNGNPHWEQAYEHWLFKSTSI